MEKCIHSKLCGACQFQGIEYFKQLQIKQNNVEKLLRKFTNIKPILGMNNPLNYRNKVQYSFGKDKNNKIIYGNYVSSTHRIIPVEDCMICDEKANDIVNSIKKLVIKYKISIFDENEYKGCLRHVLIRCTNNNEYMVILVTGGVNIVKKDLFISDLLKFNPCVKSIVQNINNKHTSMILGDKNVLLYGKDYIEDELLGLTFKISASSFYQVNKSQTKILYTEAIKAANLNKNDVLIDAYCGTGTIGLIMSKYVKEVLGIEINKDAVKDAIKNMKNNNINNCYFINADASDYMYELANSKQKVDVVIMDPPRTGADIKFLKSLVKLGPSRLVYVSCNPITLKDNLEYLTKYYKVNSIQPVDMFPFTDHIECVCSLKKK